MAKASERWFICHPETDELLVSYENRSKWRFHAFIGDSWPSEAEASDKIKELLKSKAIPKGTYVPTQR